MFPPGYFSPLHFPSPSIIIHSCKDEVSHVSLCVCVCVCVLVAQSCPTLWTPQTVAHQVFLSMEFSRQEYWSGLQFPSPEELPNPGIELWFPAWQADSLPFELQGSLSVDSVYHSGSFHLRVVGLLWLSSSKVYLRGTRWITLPF